MTGVTGVPEVTDVPGIRVIQWATGAVGSAQLREVIDAPDLELVGLFVYSADKVGRDAGDLVGRGATGVRATADKQTILELDADVVLHAASKAFPQNANSDDIVALLESGKDVITTTSYNHLPTYDPEVQQRIEAACARTGARFHAAGEHPGFMFERLATSLTALCQRVDSITVQEVVDCRAVRGKAMLVDLMGMGKQPEEISTDSAMFRAVSRQYEQAIGATADVLGLRFDEIRCSIETTTTPHDIELRAAKIPAGSVATQVLGWSARLDGRPVLVAEEHWTVAGEIPGWDMGTGDDFLVRVTVEGSPPIRVDLRMGNEPIPGLPGVAGGQLAVAMTAVRAIPYVREAPPGVVTAPVFGAYRWPQA